MLLYLTIKIVTDCSHIEFILINMDHRPALLTESLLMSVAKLLQVVLTVGDDVEHCFQGVVHTSQCGKCGYAE